MPHGRYSKIECAGLSKDGDSLIDYSIMEIPRERKIFLDWCANADPGPLTEDERKLYGQFLQHFIEKAEAGDAGCQYDLGVKFAEGIFVPYDIATAIHWFEQAVDGGDLDAMTTLASLYWLGEGGVEQDFHRAFELMEKAAESGSAVAQYELARMHWDGLGTNKDLTCAFRWFHAAACNNDEKKRYLKSYHNRIGPADSLLKVAVFRDDDIKAAAQYQVAEALANGCGVERDLLLAKDWYEAAASRGHGLAQCELGMCLAQGIGGRDIVSAVSWWETAARNGVGQAALNAAVAYSRGDGVSKDIGKANEWARVAADAGVLAGLVLLGNFELENAENVAALQRAKKWYIQAAKAGDVDGQYSVGLACHRLGAMTLNEGLLQRINERLKTGHTVSTTEEASLEAAVFAHHKEALLWFYLAEENGSEAAPEMVSFLEEHLGAEVVHSVKQYEPEFRRKFAACEF